MKCSLKDLVILPAWERMSGYWKNNILPEFQSVWKGDPRELCGAVMDPVKFFPIYFERFLVRRDLEGDLPAPGNYKAKMVVSYNYVHSLSGKIYVFLLRKEKWL